MKKLDRIAAAVLLALFSHFLNVAHSQEAKLLSAKEWFDKGMLLREAGNPASTGVYKHAVTDLDEYINAGGNDMQGMTRAYTLRARCQNLLADNESAIRDLDKAIALSPADSDIYYVRSFIHDIMGHAQLAVADLKASAQKGNEKARAELKVKGIQW